MRVSPFAILLFLLLSVPLVEIYLLISVGRVIGAGATVAVVILTAVLGAWLLRLQGLNTLARVQAASAAGQLPAVELVEGALLLGAGIFLLTPGFFTDGIGFLVLVPGVRRHLARALLGSLLSSPRTEVHVHRTEGRTIEGSYRREDSP